jgi:hypothetical protein
MSPDSVSKMPTGDAGSSCATDRIELEHDRKKAGSRAPIRAERFRIFPKVVPDDD